MRADPTVDELVAIREFLVPRWQHWGRTNGKPVTARGEGMCRFTSAFLLNYLGPGWTMRGGESDKYDHSQQKWLYGEVAAGYKDKQGNWRSHYWVRRDNTIVDLTASQFGGPNVILTHGLDHSFCESQNRIQIAQALKDVKERAKGWYTEYRQSLSPAVQ